MDTQRKVEIKKVKEVFVEKGYFALWRPRLRGERCKCFLTVPDSAKLCRDCYGSGLVGGGLYHNPDEPVWFREASFEEVQSHKVLEDTTVENHPIEPMDEFTLLSFECDFHYHIYKGCVFKLEDRYWKVMEVQENEETDEYDLPDNKRWQVSCRKLNQYEGAHAFLRDHDFDLPGDVEEPEVFQRGQIVWETVCPKCQQEGSYNIDMAHPPNQIVCADCGHIQTWGEFDGEASS